eukprot:7389141-Prymnesium_polylepis.2
MILCAAVVSRPAASVRVELYGPVIKSAPAEMANLVASCVPTVVERSSTEVKRTPVRWPHSHNPPRLKLTRSMNMLAARSISSAASKKASFSPRERGPAIEMDGPSNRSGPLWTSCFVSHTGKMPRPVVWQPG